MAEKNQSDRSLLERWAVGDKEAGHTLLDRHFAAVYRFFVSKVGSGEVEDLVQQTLLACVEGVSRFRRQSSFRVFLFGCARYVLYEHYRRSKRETRLDFTVTTVRDLRTSPSGAMWRAQRERLLLEAMQELSLELQIALELRYWEEMSDVEIASVLDLPRGTVASRLRRAREQLRGVLLPEGDAPESGEALEGWIRAARTDFLPPAS